MTSREPREQGMALGLTLFVLSVTGVLVAIAFAVAIPEHRIGTGAVWREEAFGDAEVKLISHLRQWPRGTIPDTSAVHRLGPDLFLIDETGMSPGRSGGQRRLGLLVRLEQPALNLTGAVATAESGFQAGDSSDTVPPGWSDCTPVDSLGVLQEPKGASPDPQPDPFTVANDMDADVTLPGGAYEPGPVTLDGRCDRSAPTNWGDGLSPLNPCGDYRPVVRIAGPANIRGGQGQGILLVEGDLTVTGPFQFDGIVIVRGVLTTTGADTLSRTFWGGVIAGRVQGANQFTYSKCSIDKALRAAARPKPLASRAWGELFSWP